MGKGTYKFQVDIAFQCEGKAFTLGGMQDYVDGNIQNLRRTVLNTVFVIDRNLVCFSVVSGYDDPVKSISSRSDLADQRIVTLSNAFDLIVLHIEHFENAVAN